MNFTGALIGLFVFTIVGFFHPIVIKAEYYFGSSCWPIFVYLGLISLGVSIFVDGFFLSSMFGALACGFAWSVFELFKQKERVEKGRAKRNPNRLI